ncbi:MAG: TMEM175 family protein [Candidatus Angelobacter sp.]
MFHERTGAHLVPPEKHFRWRGGEITRLEAFTDAVFAFAVTLLVVSLEVPHTFTELVAAMKGFVAFAICFAILVQVWYFHYKFSRRYGLQTVYTIVLNSALIFVVLFYVYPLKFLFTLAVGGLSRGLTLPEEQLGHMVSTYHDLSLLWLIYSAGVIAVYLLFALLYQYAYKKRRELELNEYETLCTRNAIVHFAGFVGVGVLVAIAAFVLPPQYVGYAGFLFCLNGVWGWVAGSILGKQERLALERMRAASPASASR